VVLDAGGTNLRAALMSFSSEGKPIIENFSKHPMPGTGGRDVGKEEFFDTLAALVEPLIDQAEKNRFLFFLSHGNSFPTTTVV
jgi:hexokinase